MKRKRVAKKIVTEKSPEVGQNEEAFLDFVNLNNEENSGTENFGDDESKSETESGSSSSSESDESHNVLDTTSSEDSWVDRRLGKSIKAHDKAKRRMVKLSKKGAQVKGNSSRGLSSLTRKRKKSKMPYHDPWYNKRELKTALVVIKKVMRMDEAEPFNAPIDPVALGIPRGVDCKQDYFDVIDTPMDFGTICSNLQNGVKYMNSEDVFNDVQYIWDNCCKYNTKGDYILRLMKRAKKKFMKYWTTAGLYNEQQRITSGHLHVLPSTDSTMRHTRFQPLTPADNVAGNFNLMPRQLQHQLPSASYNQSYQSRKPLPNTIQPQFSQLPLSSYTQPYRLQQPQPSTNQPQFSQLQIGADSGAAGQSQFPTGMDFSLKRQKYIPSSKVGSMIDGASQSQPQQPRLSYEQRNHLQQPQQSTSQPEPYQLQAGADCANRCEGGCTMRCNKYVPWCLMDPMLASSTQPLAQQQPSKSHKWPNETKEPEASVGQPQPSQPPASGDVGKKGHLHLSVTRSGKKYSRRPPRCSVDPVTESPSQQHKDPFSPSKPQPQPQQSSQDHNQEHESQQPMQKRKRGRGPTRCLFLNDLQDGERIFVPINKLGQPVGRDASKLSSFLGNIARNGHMAPLTYVNWRFIPDAAKEDMWQVVQSKFEIDPNGKNWVMKSLATKWRDWKAELKASHYYPHKTDEERMKDCDARVLPDQWPILISFWNSETEKKRSATNRANRKKQKAVHTTGTKSFARIREEERAKRPDGKEPTRAELYVLTHTRKDGQPVDEDAAVAIAKLREQATQKQKISEGSNSNDRDDTFCQVMGEEKGNHVRTYGLGPTPSDLWGPTPRRCDLMRIAFEAKRSANEEVSRILEKMEAMEQKYAHMEAQIATISSSMQILLEKVGASSKNLGTKQVLDTSNAPQDSPQPHLNSSSSHAVPSHEAADEEE